MTDDAPLPRLAIAGLVIAFAVAWFAGIGQRALIHPDEGRYAEIAREMVVTGDWLTPRLNGLKYFEKPPLQYWITAAAFKAFGIHEWTARLWTVLSTFAATLFLGWAGARLGGPRLGLYAAAALAGCVGYAVNAHVLALDGALAAFLTIAFGAFVVAQHDGTSGRGRRNLMWLAWAAIAGATLTKGPIGAVIPAASLVLYTLVARDAAVWRRLHLASGIPLYLILAAPWFVAVSLANDEFFRFFFIHEHFQRFLTTEHGRGAPWWYFAPILVVGTLPWLLVLAWGAGRAWRAGPSGANGFSWQRFALAWSVFVFVFFSASGSKLPSYILPLFPPLALVAAWLLDGMAARTLARLAWPLFGIGAAALGGALLGYDAIARRLVADPGTLASALAFAPWVKAALAVAAGGGAVALGVLYGTTPRRRTIAVLATAGATLVAVQIAAVGYDEFAPIRSTRDMLRAAVAAHGPFRADVPFYHVRMHDQTTPFYLGRTTTFVEFRDEFALGQDAEPERTIADEKAWIPVWERLPQGYAMLSPADYQRLAAQGVPMKLLARDPRRVVVSRR